MTDEGAQSSTRKLVLKFGGSLVEQLGAQLYPSVTATVAELISNAWDANAKRVWVQVPFGQWEPDDAVEVIDDGHGMTRSQAQDCYLIVGRKRRTISGVKSEGGLRFVHGRKGIGKLAAFGTAGILDCATVRDGVSTVFRLNYDNIRILKPTDDYIVEDVPYNLRLESPSGEKLAHGTRIRLTNLKQKRAIPRDQFITSMSRRFALDGHEMQVIINENDQLQRFQIECAFKFPRDGKPNPDISVDDEGWANETVMYDGVGRPVRWWIGFTEKPLGEDVQQGISITAHGKMAQRPFKFDRAGGTEGQLGQEYLVGEVEANWLDEGKDIEDDLIQSNRDQLQLEDERLRELVEWGQRRLNWALRERGRLKRERNLNNFKASDKVKDLIKPFTKTEQRRFIKVAEAVSKLPEATDEDIERTVGSVIEAQAERAVREMMDTIEGQDDAFQDQVWAMVHEFSLVDARRLLSIVEARLSAIRKLKDAISQGAKEVPDIHNIVKNDPWLLDPRWNLVDDELDLTKTGIGYQPELDEDGNRLDFLFALAPHAPAPLDEIIVVEIKRGTYADGRERKADLNEVNKFHLYVASVQSHYQKSSDPPTVRGLMIAQGYTPQADLIRKNLEGGPVRLTFSTWDKVIDETERMHTAWLDLSRMRADG